MTRGRGLDVLALAVSQIAEAQNAVDASGGVFTQAGPWMLWLAQQNA